MNKFNSKSNWFWEKVVHTMFEAKAKDSKKIQGQGPTFRGQTLSRIRTKMVEANAKDRGHNFPKLEQPNFP